MLIVRCYDRWWRALAAGLLAVSRLSLLWILWRVLTANDPPITPPLLAEMLVVVWALPGAAAWLIGRALTAAARVTDGELIIERPDSRAAVPLSRLAAVRPWRIPLPEPGLALELVDGGRVPFALAARDPSPLVAAVDPTALRHPNLVYAAARRPPRGWRALLGRYVLFALPPAAVLFNAHQHIAYGGTLGEYYLMGAGAWLRDAGIHWATVSAYLLLYGSALRGAVETLALSAAWTLPAAARAVRNALEQVSTIAFYAGVPLLLALRFWG